VHLRSSSSSRLALGRRPHSWAAAIALFAAVVLASGCLPPPQWSSSSHGPAAANTSGALQVVWGSPVAVGQLWTSYQTSAGGVWTGRIAMPGAAVSLSGDVELARNANGRLEAFTKAASAPTHLWRTRQTASSPVPWAAWTDMAISVNQYAVGQNADGRLEVFATVAAGPGIGRVVHAWQLTPGGNYSSWAFLGDLVVPAGQHHLVTGRNADGRLEVFVAGSGYPVKHAWQVAANGDWSSWADLPLSSGMSGLDVAPNADGRLEAFVTTCDASLGGCWLFHAWQTTPNGPWTGGTALAPLSSRGGGPLRVAPSADGRLEVFYGTWVLGSVGHIWQLAVNGTSGWSTPTSVTPASGYEIMTVISLVANADGRLEVFLQSDGGSGSAVTHAWQTSPNGNWSPTTLLISA
jgi:hypothetical protein